jgi:hypothetical protein
MKQREFAMFDDKIEKSTHNFFWNLIMESLQVRKGLWKMQSRVRIGAYIKVQRVLRTSLDARFAKKLGISS